MGRDFYFENKNLFAFYFACKFFVTGYLDIVFYDLRLQLVSFQCTFFSENFKFKVEKGQKIEGKLVNPLALF
jgi:hypothetical protein